jgi:hypothetical protein
MENNIEIKSNDVDYIVKEVNKLRLSNKNKWLFLEINFKGNIILIKSFDTWIQIAKYNDMVIGSTPSDCKVSAFKNEILNILKKVK